CGTIHYQNPKIVAGCIVAADDLSLLCKRANEPRYGLWTMPAGFMENHETVAQAAVRETLEEACAEVVDVTLYALFSLPHINQVYVMFRGELLERRFSPGVESLETTLFAEHQIPWDALAFPVVRESLRLYYGDRRAGVFPAHTGTIARGAGRELEISID
ncbi:MAG: NUDIX hydrolase, partial [Burkholderiaceae bacterium]